jgi:hypothetical protein
VKIRVGSKVRYVKPTDMGRMIVNNLSPYLGKILTVKQIVEDCPGGISQNRISSRGCKQCAHRFKVDFQEVEHGYDDGLCLCPTRFEGYNPLKDSEDRLETIIL